MLPPAYGSLATGLQMKRQHHEVLLIRGGTDTVGLMAVVLGKQLGATVIATTRSKASLATLRRYGADYPLLDDQQLTAAIHKIVPEGVDKTLELVGFTTLLQDLALTRLGGQVCFTGALGGQWTYPDFSPFMIPTGKYLTSYTGEASDLPVSALADVLELVKKAQITLPIAKVYHGLEEVGQAQANLESGQFNGKHVVVL